MAFLLGDSVAFNLRSDFPAGSFPGLHVTGSTQLGCGLLPDQLTAEGKVITPGPDCIAWHQRIGTEITETDPQVGVLMVGSWEQYDRIVDGQVLTLGSAAFEKHVDAELSTLLDQLDPSRRPVAVTNVPCHRTPDFGVGPEPHIVNDENRVRKLNEIVARFVASSKGPSVHLLDLHTFLCADGYTVTKDGVTLRTDGLHFTPGGAHIIWSWLAPQTAGPRTAARHALALVRVRRVRGRPLDGGLGAPLEPNTSGVPIARIAAAASRPVARTRSRCGSAPHSRTAAGSDTGWAALPHDSGGAGGAIRSSGHHQTTAAATATSAASSSPTRAPRESTMTSRVTGRAASWLTGRPAAGRGGRGTTRPCGRRPSLQADRRLPARARRGPA